MGGRIGRPMTAAEESNLHDVGPGGLWIAVSRAAGLCAARCFPSCDRWAVRRGLCQEHYEQLERDKEPTEPNQAESDGPEKLEVSEAIRRALQRETLFAEALVEFPELRALLERWLEARSRG